MKLSLSTKTLIGMVLGAIIGFIVGPKIVAIGFIGTIFLRVLQMAKQVVKIAKYK